MRTIVRSTTLLLFLSLGLLVLGAASASAFATQMTNNYGGADLVTGDTVTVTVDFSTDDFGTGAAANNLQVLSVSVLFDDAVMTYSPRGSGSEAPTYALYIAGGRGPVSFGELTTNLTIRAGTSNQVLLDWSSTAVPSGTRDPCGNYGTYPADPAAPSGNACGFTMAVLQFTVHTAGADATFTLSNSSPGNVISLGDGSNPGNPVSGAFTVSTIPEPTTALLVGLGLAGLGVAGRRRS
jgi:hypothetical protein